MARLTIACTNCGDFIASGDRISVIATGHFGERTALDPAAVICGDCAKAAEEALGERQPIPWGDTPVCYGDEHDEGYDGPSGCCASCDDRVEEKH